MEIEIKVFFNNALHPRIYTNVDLHHDHRQRQTTKAACVRSENTPPATPRPWNSYMLFSATTSLQQPYRFIHARHAAQSMLVSEIIWHWHTRRGWKTFHSVEHLGRARNSCAHKIIATWATTYCSLCARVFLQQIYMYAVDPLPT